MSYRIFVVEDNRDHALLIRRGIEDRDCAMIHFENGPDALKACEEAKTLEAKPNLVLLDLNLPGIDGFEALKRLKELNGFERIPVVMLTTSRRREEIEKAYQLGAWGFVVKSEDFSELVAKLKRVKDYWLRTVEFPQAQPVAGAGRI